MSGSGDLLGALPEHVLQHVLSVIPTRELVQASLLSRRWRHIWRSTPVLRVDDWAKGRDHAMAMFVNRFLLLRDGVSPLSLFKMDNLWIRHAALTCRTLALAAAYPARNRERLRLTGQPLAATRNLTKMKLCDVSLAGSFVDFSCCPALLKLTLRKCVLVNCEAVVSPSLDCLIVTGCSFMTTTRISIPSLRWLHLADCLAVAPTLDSMPSLTTATIWLSRAKRDDSCVHCLLLHGLSEATSLKLIAPYLEGQANLQLDLRWCPTFSNLKTLILNEWCVFDDAIALACLLRHSPVLENLTFEVTVYGSDPRKASRSNITLEQTTFEHLKTVEIKCPYRICSWAFKILKVLTTCGVPLSKISIQATTIESEAYNFVCTGITSIES